MSVFHASGTCTDRNGKKLARRLEAEARTEHGRDPRLITVACGGSGSGLVCKVLLHALATQVLDQDFVETLRRKQTQRSLLGFR